MEGAVGLFFSDAGVKKGRRGDGSRIGGWVQNVRDFRPIYRLNRAVLDAPHDDETLVFGFVFGLFRLICLLL